MVSLLGTLRQCFINGRFDRFPCGSETAAHWAPLGGARRLGSDQVIPLDSIIETRLFGRSRLALGRVPPSTFTAEVEGMANGTGQGALTIGEADPVGTEFLLP
jgi:proline racemase/trans-L-3-hydroxyproline dehydratase